MTIKKTLATVPLLLIGVVLPLLGRLELIATWPIIIIIVYGFLLNVSQPPLDVKRASADKHDRNSMFLIVIGALLCFVIPISDFAYGKTKNILLNQAATWIGLIMIWGGLLFRYWSIRVLGKFFTAKVVIQSDHQLINTGPYKYLRHPSYLGAWTSQVGISMLLQSVFGLCFSIVAYFCIYIYRINCEEKALAETFPKKYPDYKKRTWGMLPYIF